MGTHKRPRRFFICATLPRVQLALMGYGTSGVRSSGALNPTEIAIETMTTSKSGREARLVLESGKAAIKALREESAEALDRLQDYTERFEVWQREWKGASAERETLARRDAEIGRRIAEQHATVIQLAQRLRDSMEHSLKNLRGWTKGLRAYVDHFPKRLGTMKPRKG